MKTCKYCFIEKPFDDFYKNLEMADGYHNKCKVCWKSYSKKYKLDNAEKYKKYYQDLSKTDKRRESHRLILKRWRADNKELSLKRTQENRLKNPLKYAAHTAVNNALKLKKITREPCIKCGSLKTDAHHEDYSKPLEVIWFCRIHHAERHVEINKEKLR